MLKRVILSFAVLTLLCYLLGVIGFVRAFVLSFLALCYVPPFLFFVAIVWWISAKSTKEKYSRHLISFHLIILGCGILLLLAREVINEYYMPNASDPVRISAKLTVLVLVILFCRDILKKGWSKKSRLLTAALALFILVPFVHQRFISTEQLQSPPANLGSLGYVEWGPAGNNIDKISVTEYDPNLAFDGLNLYTVTDLNWAALIDMTGKTLHKWNLDPKEQYGQTWWEHPVLCDNGDLLIYCKDHVFTRIDWNSNPKWSNKLRAHHSFETAENQDLWVLSRKDSRIMFFGLPVPVLEDYIAVLSPKGQLLKEISITKAAKSQIPSKRFFATYLHLANPKKLGKTLRRLFTERFMFASTTTFDLIHTNSIFLINKDINNVAKKGNILVSMRDLDTIGVLDIEKNTFLWTWGQGTVSAQHHATILENGNVLLFDNGYERGYSRIIEFNPLTKGIEWEYHTEPKKEFFSPRRGSCQRLANGNTLITESYKGIVFEVTPAGQTVWKFYITEVNKETKERKTLYRMTRIDPKTNKLPQQLDL